MFAHSKAILSKEFKPQGIIVGNHDLFVPKLEAANETARFQADASSCVAPVVILPRSNWVQLVRTHGILGHSATLFRHKSAPGNWHGHPAAEGRGAPLEGHTKTYDNGYTS